MALTPEEFAQINDVIAKLTVVQLRANDMATLLLKVKSRTDPSDNLNDQITFTEIRQKYLPQYQTLKTQIQTAFQALP